MNHAFSKIWIKVIILAIALGVGAVWYYFNKNWRELKEQEITVLEKDIARWEIYQRPATIFRFEYPKKWTVEELKFSTMLQNEQGENVIEIVSDLLSLTSSTASKFCATHSDDKRCETLKTDKYSISIDWASRDWESEFQDGARAKIVIPKEYTPEDWALTLILYKSDSNSKNIFRQVLNSFKFVKFDIDSSNWQTFQSEKYGFQLKYPLEWQYNDGEWYFQFFPDLETISPDIKDRAVPTFTVNISDHPHIANLEEIKEILKKEIEKTISQWEGELDFQDFQVQEVKVGNIDALTYLYFGYPFSRAYMFPHPYQNKIIAIIFNNQEITLRGITPIQTFYQILSTFRFLE